MYEYMILMMSKNNQTSLLSRSLQQTNIASRFIQDQVMSFFDSTFHVVYTLLICALVSEGMLE